MLSVATVAIFAVNINVHPTFTNGNVQNVYYIMYTVWLCSNASVNRVTVRRKSLRN